jgi:predicted alpha-1,6-mannanase (GH76 family)
MRAVLSARLRPLLGLPGTRLGRTGAGHWHYWWQAHLLDCLLDAHLRAPSPVLAGHIAGLTRGLWLRNRGWTNRYFDDMAWLGLALHRAGPLAGPAGVRAMPVLLRRLRSACTGEGGGGTWWRAGDDYKNTAATGPTAILLARTGDPDTAGALLDWLERWLVDPDTGLVRDGVHLRPDGGHGRREDIAYTYCQGVFLGGCLAVTRAGSGDPRWPRRAARTVAAVRAHLADPDGVLPGQGTGDGGLFAGILCRYLALAASELPEADGRSEAARLVTASAAAAWDTRPGSGELPWFGDDWRAATADDRPARAGAAPGGAGFGGDLSVQLGAWMALEAAASLAR